MRYQACISVVNPEEVLVPSSKGNMVYIAVPKGIYNDASCSCPGYFHKGKCKHLEYLDRIRCRFMTSKIDEDLKECPNCGNKLEIIETESEFI